MARPQETFNKKEQEKLRAKKRKEKQEKKEARKACTDESRAESDRRSP